MTQTAAAIDIGTNSVKITVGRQESGNITVLADETRVTRLGKRVDADGRLDPNAKARTLDALREMAQKARTLGAQTIAAVGTSALRDARDGADFVSEAAQTIGGTVEIITGEREADLIYQAGRRDPDLARFINNATTVVATDVGGGSTEIVLGQGEQVRLRVSLQLGAVRLAERAHLAGADPLSQEDVQNAMRLARPVLDDIPFFGDGTIVVIASGGTAANLAAMALKERTPGVVIDADVLHGVVLTINEIEARIDQLAALPLAERRNVPGLEPDRADVIVAGAIVQAQVLKRLAADRIVVSARGLRYGLLYTLLSNETH